MSKKQENLSERDRYYQEYRWPDGKTQSEMPHVNWDFRIARDPFQLPQILAMQKSEAQRRDEAQGRNSETVILEKPLPTYRPKTEFAKAVDAAIFNSRMAADKQASTHNRPSSEKSEVEQANDDAFQQEMSELCGSALTQTHHSPQRKR
jgi:hypothetical protein